MEKTFYMLLYRAFHAQRNYLRPYIGDLGLEIGQPKILAYLAKRGACCQKDLADYFQIDSAAVSRMLVALEKNGFITKKTDEESRRSNSIELTDKGYAAQQKWRLRCRETEKTMLRGFSENDKTCFAEYLARVYQNFREEKKDET